MSEPLNPLKGKQSMWKDEILGNCISTNKQSIGKDYPFADILYLDTGSITANKIEKLQEYTITNAPSRAKRIVEEDDIIYSSVRPNQLHYGFIKNPKDNLVVSTGFVVISCKKEKILPKFLFYNLSSDNSTEYLHSIAEASTSTYPSLKPSDIESLEILLPPLPEQKAIASVLSSLDDKIDLLHRQNKTLESMAEALFREWFVEGKGDRWKICTLNDLCNVIGSGGTPSTKISSYYNGYINWYSTKELKDNFLYESENKITQEGLENSAAKIFPAMTIVIAIYAAPTVGRLGILGNESSFNQAACGLIANEDICSYEFIYLYLKTQRSELNLVASGSAQQNLNVGKIKSYPAFIVPKELMTEFKEIIRPIFNHLNSNTVQIRTLEKLRDTLLPKLMSGKVRVKMEE